MSYQTQKQPEYSGSPFEETEEPAVSAPAPKNKMTPGLRVTLIILLCAAFFFTGVSLRYRTNDPFAVSADPGFLSLPEFVLRDYETGEPVQENSLSGFTDKYTYTFSVYNYETSRGIRIGDSWNTFVDAYGDTYINEVSVDGTLFPLDSPMTLQEFHDSCVLGGEVSPYNSEVEITFIKLKYKIAYGHIPSGIHALFHALSAAHMKYCHHDVAVTFFVFTNRFLIFIT